ncbi:MAG: PKD domain-containing protein [Ferruginibacter sp.]|nr:PKD domain-containing protein [Ferruginibacter sp.]
MKKILFVLIFSIAFISSFANHTKGGWMYYEYLGPGSSPNTAQYKIVLKLYTECSLNPGQTDDIIPFTIFDAITNQRIANISVNVTSDVNTNNCTQQNCHPCISPIPSICYKIRTYETIQELPITTSGFRIAYQRCCRISGIINLLTPSNDFGETWTVVIPGNQISDAEKNNSAKFSQNDTAIICANSSFEFDFSATDIDNDSLVYSFTPAYTGGSTSAPSPNPSSTPPFSFVSYSFPYSGLNPLGNLAIINRQTGIVSGVAPGIGVYVVTVVVSEYIRGTNIKKAEVRKSLHIQVANCSSTKPVLEPDGTTCDGFLINFENQGSNTNVTTWLWNFGDPASGANNTSTSPTPSHDYSASGAGDYLVKLYVNKGLQCEDSAQAIFKVYPGFRPAFEVLGQCKNTAIQFNDLSVHDFGTINKWTWNFGDPASGANNTSTLKNPTHIFATAGTYRVTLLVESDKGCSQLIPKDVEVKDKPAFTIPRDTLICTIDTLQLTATGTGTIVWSPNYMISDINSLTPLVSPDITTTYTATFTDAFGCSGTDDVTINVVDRVTQGNNYDTTICTGDAAQLRLFSNALYYTWTPNDGSLNNTTIKNPTATPTVATSYNVIGKISDKCFAQNTINVTPVPYPNVVAPDVSVCFGTSTQLQASGGSIYNWSPRTYLNSTTIANPTVTNPVTSVLYTLTVRDVLGCPKPVQKLVKLDVVRIRANAGPRDTSVVLGQPLQLNASGGTNYVWLPDNRWLSSTTINNPVALPQNDIEYIVQVSDINGCTGLDSIRVRLFRVAPGLYVPNAFTPNGDGKNDIFRPVVLGIKSLDLFQVYNRFGQMVYSGTDIAKGWDGTFGGRPQDPANFVWIAEATDYTGKKIKRKGNVILIRQ